MKLSRSSIAAAALAATLCASGLKSDAQAGNAIPAHAPTSALAATHDFDGDGKSDILWRDTSGDVAVWLMNGATVSQSAGLVTVPSTSQSSASMISTATGTPIFCGRIAVAALATLATSRFGS